MEQVPVKAGLIGMGRWGRNVAKALHAAGALNRYVTKDVSENYAFAKEAFPQATASTLEEVCADSKIGAVVVATPIDTHAAVAQKLLESGKHVLVEKPLAATSKEGAAIAALAASHNLILATGYVFLYHPVYQELKRRVSREDIVYVSCTWKKYGTFKEPIELNLLTHHLALAFDLLGMPSSGTCVRGKNVESECDEIETTLRYAENATLLSHIDRGSDERVHTIEIKLKDGTHFLWNEAKLYKIEDGRETEVYENSTQPLQIEVQSFLDAVGGVNTGLPTQGDFGVSVLTIHELLA